MTPKVYVGGLHVNTLHADNVVTWRNLLHDQLTGNFDKAPFLAYEHDFRRMARTVQQCLVKNEEENRRKRFTKFFSNMCAND
jgi:hypothetical protein